MSKLFNKIIFIVIILAVLGAGAFFAYKYLPKEKQTTENIIASLLAKKYNKKTSEITVTITKEIESYMRGTFTIASGTSTAFLAAKKDNKWELAYGGLGEISCDVVNKYNFPKDMVSDCVNIKTTEVYEGQTFLITMLGNQSSGYEWRAGYDPKAFQLVKHEYVNAPKDLMNGAGFDKFNFKALIAGQAEITFIFVKVGDPSTKAVDTIYYEITSKPNL